MKFNSCIFTAFCFVELYSYFRLGQINNLLIRLTVMGLIVGLILQELEQGFQ